MSLSCKIKGSFSKFLNCGLSPRKLALTLALGVAIGVLPLPWGTTLLCAAAALVFRLNQAGIQVINYLAYPLQLMLFFPFYRLGERLFPTRVIAPAERNSGAAMFLVSHAAESTIKAMGAWLLIAPELAILLYCISLLIFRRKART